MSIRRCSNSYTLEQRRRPKKGHKFWGYKIMTADLRAKMLEQWLKKVISFQAVCIFKFSLEQRTASVNVVLSHLGEANSVPPNPLSGYEGPLCDAEGGREGKKKDGRGRRKNTPTQDIFFWLRMFLFVNEADSWACFAMLATAKQCEVPANERCKCGDEDVAKWMCLSIGCCWQDGAPGQTQECYRPRET